MKDWASSQPVSKQVCGGDGGHGRVQVMDEVVDLLQGIYLVHESES